MRLPSIMVILSIALVLRLVWALLITVDPVSDSAAYHQFATTLVTHGVYGFSADVPGAYWAVGPAALYAGAYKVFGIGGLAVVVVNMISSLVAVWEAARYLVDYEGMAGGMLKGQMEVHQAFWPEGFPGALTDTPFSYDPEKARQILADAGVETPINVTMDVISAPTFVEMAQAIQASFAEGGINLEIVAGTGAQVITKYRARTHEAMLLYWGPDFMDPHSNAKAFAFNADNSDDKYASTTTWRNAWMPPAELNEKTMAALGEQDAEKRLEMYMELQEATQAEAPFVIMFQAIKQVAMRDNVQGFVNGATSDYVFYRLVTKE